MQEEFGHTPRADVDGAGDLDSVFSLPSACRLAHHQFRGTAADIDDEHATVTQATGGTQKT